MSKRTPTLRAFARGDVGSGKVKAFILDKLVKQREICMNDVGECRYRGPNGLKCGIGHILTDNDYHEILEGKTVKELLEELRISMSPRKIKFLSDIQTAHDSVPVHKMAGDSFIKYITGAFGNIKLSKENTYGLF